MALAVANGPGLKHITAQGPAHSRTEPTLLVDRNHAEIIFCEHFGDPLSIVIK
jgi:hypothetical protein